MSVWGPADNNRRICFECTSNANGNCTSKTRLPFGTYGGSPFFGLWAMELQSLNPCPGPVTAAPLGGVLKAGSLGGSNMLS